MESLGKEAKNIFCMLIEAIEGKQYFKIECKNYLPLTIELLDKEIKTEFGFGCTYSLCNYYEKNGDLMQSPEMCFLFIDNRTEASDDLEKVIILPYMFQYADLGLYELSIHIEHDNVIGVNKNMQSKHTLLAMLWLSEIKSIGYLKF
ncbi:conserved hypothetical protein [Sphingobacterium sp. PM2-P1-29]|nr:conserved hypothetical protein [Sphingobacterium sp. PM2-P1-29]